MRKLLFILFISILSFDGFAQNNLGKIDDLGRVAISTYVENVDNIPENVKNQLRNKLNQIITRQGMSNISGRFVLFPSIDIIEERKSNTAPPMYFYDMEISLYIGDNTTESIFNSMSFPAKSMDKNQSRSLNQAISKVNVRNQSITKFIQDSKNRIIEYFNTKCDFILKEAMSMASRKEYDKAIFNLLSIPQICKDCYFLGQDKSIEVFKMKLEEECSQNIANAKVEIAKNNHSVAANYLSGILPDVSCYDDAQDLIVKIEDHICADALGKARGAWAAFDAQEAGRWLGEVSSDSKCATDALALGNEIKAKLKIDEDRDWEFELKTLDLQSQAIDAVRDIGVAFGENQVPNPTTWINNLE